MLRSVRTSRFKRDVKRCLKRDKDMARLRVLLNLLRDQRPLPASYKDHPLQGKWKSCRNAHIEPDWLLLYRVSGGKLHLLRMGTHADLFA